MVPGIRKPPISHRRKATALMVAGIADFAQIMLLPALGFGYVLDDVIDILTAIILTAICGFKWQFVFAFGVELIPGLDLLPTWSAVALLIPSIPTDTLHSTQPAAVNASKYPVIEVTGIAIPPVQAQPLEQLPESPST